jgi:hypothetical protein
MPLATTRAHKAQAQGFGALGLGAHRGVAAAVVRGAVGPSAIGVVPIHAVDVTVTRVDLLDGGADGLDKIVVEVDVRLTQTGYIAGDPRVINRSQGPLFDNVASAALRALKKCEPYTTLPADLYQGGWDHMILEFEPGKMLR